MAERSRIRFSPVTKEIEIEGSETFVKTYFQKLQQLLSHFKAGKAERPARKAPRSRQAAKVSKPRVKAETRKKKGTKVTHVDAVIALIRQNAEGMTTAALKEKTGLTERQIWGIAHQAEKQGKIKKAKRGLYVAA